MAVAEEGDPMRAVFLVSLRASNLMWLLELVAIQELMEVIQVLVVEPLMLPED
jgi:hypothetical protein